MFVFLAFAFISCNSGDDNSSVSVPGVSDEEIVIGSWGPLTGPAALWGSILKGTDAYFKMINDEGGINGRKIRYIFKDDAYDPSRTVPVVRELVQRDEIFVAAGGIGTANNMAVKDFLAENGVPWVSPMSGATEWSQPPKENIYTSFPVYFDEGDVMAKYAVDELGLKKIGVIYQNDDFGRSGLISAKKVLLDNGLDFVAALPVELADTDLSSHAARLKESGAEAVLLWTTPRHAAIILGTAAVIDLKPTWFASVVLSDMTLMHQITKGAWEGVYFNYPSAVMYNDENSETMMKYKAAFAKYYPEERWGAFPAGGFMWMESLVEGLKKAGPDLTRESFLSAMQNIDGFVGVTGFPISYSADNHLGTRSLSIMKCVSATEAENISGLISGTADYGELAEMLEQN